VKDGRVIGEPTGPPQLSSIANEVVRVSSRIGVNAYRASAHTGRSTGLVPVATEEHAAQLRWEGCG
jgi:hypothetical protein